MNTITQNQNQNLTVTHVGCRLKSESFHMFSLITSLPLSLHNTPVKLISIPQICHQHTSMSSIQHQYVINTTPICHQYNSNMSSIQHQYAINIPPVCYQFITFHKDMKRRNTHVRSVGCSPLCGDMDGGGGR